MIHPMFHVSVLHKYLPYPSHVISSPNIQLEESFSYKEEPVAIVDKQVKKLCLKKVPLVKVICRNHSVKEATWETKDSKCASYPHLFLSPGNAFPKFRD